MHKWSACANAQTHCLRRTTCLTSQTIWAWTYSPFPKWHKCLVCAFRQMDHLRKRAIQPPILHKVEVPGADAALLLFPVYFLASTVPIVKASKVKTSFGVCDIACVTSQWCICAIAHSKVQGMFFVMGSSTKGIQQREYHNFSTFIFQLADIGGSWLVLN